MSHMDHEKIFDLFVIGGGINGCGIARDAAGRGYSVMLAEMGDLASATSSSSTKLFHGGLRYLEYFEFRLVREALIEREILLKSMPHISWPMRFVLPYHSTMRFENDTPTSRLLNALMPWLKGQRPAWLIRLGLFMYDHMGGRKILPATRTINLKKAEEGKPLKKHFQKAYEYSDCWVEDSRLVVLNARDAEKRGAKICVRMKVQTAERKQDFWVVSLKDMQTGATYEVKAKALVNAGGPWVEDIIQKTVRSNSKDGVRLVRGSHIVTKRLYEHDKCYFFQGADGRIVFTIPYETDFTLIGTTEAEHDDISNQPFCSPEEKKYLLDFVNTYFENQITQDDIVWTYSGVRPLYDDGASSATAATRDYTLKIEAIDDVPLLNVFGGKITTYRRLAESALAKLSIYIGEKGESWTAQTALPGGDFAVEDFDKIVRILQKDYSFLTDFHAKRLVRAYGLEARLILRDANTLEDLGEYFGATLTAREVAYLMAHEYAQTAEDILWRRSKLGLRLTDSECVKLEGWIAQKQKAELNKSAATVFQVRGER